MSADGLVSFRRIAGMALGLALIAVGAWIATQYQALTADSVAYGRAHPCPAAEFSRTSRDCIYVMPTTISNLKFVPDPNGNSKNDECDISLEIGVENPVAETGSSGCSPYKVGDSVSATVWGGHLVQFQDGGQVAYNFAPGNVSPQLVITLVILLTGTGAGILAWPFISRLREPPATRLVIRPGLLAGTLNYILASAVLLFSVWGTGQASGLFGFMVVLAGAGALGIVYLLTASVEVEAGSVSKHYFLALRRTAERRELAVVKSHVSGRGGGYDEYTFYGGHRPAFTIIAAYIWRTRDIKAVLTKLGTRVYQGDAPFKTSAWSGFRTLGFWAAVVAVGVVLALAINRLA